MDESTAAPRRHADGVIARVAFAQYGIFNRAQARDAGLSDRQLRLRVESGRYERLALHTFRVGGTPMSWHQRVMAACIAAGPDAAASHRTAAALHRFDTFRAGVVEITVPQARRDFHMAGVVVHSSAYWDETDITTVDGIPVATPERTLCMLGAVATRDRVEHALDSAERDGTVRRVDVADTLADVRERGRTGVVALAEVLERRAELDGIPRSVLERNMLNLLHEHAIPLPACQVAIRRPDGHLAYLDFAYRDLQLGIEVDGNIAHATPRQRAADNLRGNDLDLRDIHIIRFTYEQVLYQPELVATTVRRHLHHRRMARAVRQAN